ncbi:unnamed protein product [Gordionus sp. m RMFG-2023]
MEQDLQIKKRPFKKYTFRGVDLDQLLDMTLDQLKSLLTARARRKLNRGLPKKAENFLKKLRKAKKEALALEKPEEILLVSIMENPIPKWKLNLK